MKVITGVHAGNNPCPVLGPRHDCAPKVGEETPLEDNSLSTQLAGESSDAAAEAAAEAAAAKESGDPDKMKEAKEKQAEIKKEKEMLKRKNVKSRKKQKREKKNENKRNKRRKRRRRNRKNVKKNKWRGHKMQQRNPKERARRSGTYLRIVSPILQ
jgi:hypothetical protein